MFELATFCENKEFRATSEKFDFCKTQNCCAGVPGDHTDHHRSGESA